MLTNELIMSIGPQGSGKSTWAEKYVSDNPNAIHLSTDKMRAEFGTGVADQTINGLVYGRLRHRVEATLLSGKTAIVDATFVKKAWRKDYLEIAKRVGVKTKAIVFSAPKHVLVARVNERAKNGGLFVPETVIDKYIKDLQIPDGSEFDEVVFVRS